MVEHVSHGVSLEPEPVSQIDEDIFDLFDIDGGLGVCGPCRVRVVGQGHGDGVWIVHHGRGGLPGVHACAVRVAELRGGVLVVATCVVHVVALWRRPVGGEIREVLHVILLGHRHHGRVDHVWVLYV